MIKKYDNIVFWPDDVLLSESEHVTDIGDDENLIIEGMINVMREQNGFAIAAPQVGALKRIIAINLNAINQDMGDDENMVMINPKLIDGIGEILIEEGCLSLPGITVPMLRSAISIIEYEDMSGEKKTLTADGILSVAIQHEIDHLDGNLIIENLNRSDRRKAMKNLLKRNKNKNKKSA